MVQLTALILAASVGQTYVYGPRPVPVLSEETRKAQARALAEFRASQPGIEAKLIDHYTLKNERLSRKIAAVDGASTYVRALTSGGDAKLAWMMGAEARDPTLGRRGLPRSPVPDLPLKELRREHWLLVLDLKDARTSYGEAKRFYRLEYPIRYNKSLSSLSGIR